MRGEIGSYQSTHVYTGMCVGVVASTCVCASIYVCACLYVCASSVDVYVCAYVCVCICAICDTDGEATGVGHAALLISRAGAVEIRVGLPAVWSWKTCSLVHHG